MTNYAMASVNQVDERLLQVLAEQLKLPLLQIALAAELQSPQNTADIARAGLRLIDGYILATGSESQMALPLEPVSISATLQNVAHQLQPHAKQYGCTIEIDVAGKYGPVMAHQAGLESALVVLGQAFIEAQTSKAARVILGVHRSKQG